MALDAVLEALTDEQLAQLDMTRYEALCAALAELTVEQAGHSSHPICGATHKEFYSDDNNDKNDHKGECPNVAWTELTVENGVLMIGGSAADRSDYTDNSQYSNYYTLPEGSYYLGEDIELEELIEIEGTVNLCLNGHSITKTSDDKKGDDGVIRIMKDAIFSLCNCKDSGTITYTNNTMGRGVRVGTTATAGDATFNMYSGEISGNHAGSTDQGQDGGVYVKGTFNMYGGKITGNDIPKKESGNGGGVRVGSGSITMYGGEISGNTSLQHGGGIYSNKSGTTINIYGGTIKDNETKTDGGGVYIANTQFTLSGDAIITGNKAPNGSGGGVFAAYGSQFTTSDNAVISGNSAANYGGGVYLSGGTTSPVSSFTMNNGTISDNHSDNNGSGVHVRSSGMFTMKKGTIGGSTSADGNTAKNGGGVYVADSNTTFTMESGSISGNTASKDGGVRLDKGTFNMSGSAVVSRNTADGYGGGVDANNGTFTMSGGSITGNSTTGDDANFCGGGGVDVYNGGSFTMSGGSITGNNSLRGGGVELNGSGTMTVSGSVQIMDNWQNGTLDSSGVYVKGNKSKANNLYLYSTKTVAIDTAGLNADARIGVTTNDWPVTGSPVKIVTNATNEESHYTAIFTPDAEEADYKITKKNDKAVHTTSAWVNVGDGYHHQTCTVCERELAHEVCTFGQPLKYNATSHWEECTKCGNKQNEAAHEFLPDSDKCIGCDYTKSSTITIITPTQPGDSKPAEGNPSTGAVSGPVGYIAIGLAVVGALCLGAKKLTKKHED